MILAVLGDAIVQGRISVFVIGVDLLRHGRNPRSEYRVGFRPGITRCSESIAPQAVNFGQSPLQPWVLELQG